MFYGSSGLTTVIIGSGITSLYGQIFKDCTSLTTVRCKRMTAPSIVQTTFQNVGRNGTLYVPIGSSGYDAWMGTGNYYLGLYEWTKVTQ